MKKSILLFLILLYLFIPKTTEALISSGSYTLKLAGGDYSTWAGFWDDLDNLTGDITLTVDASAFSEDTAPATVTESLNGHTITITPASFPTTTDASTGARITGNYVEYMLHLSTEGPGIILIEGIVFIEGTSEPVRMLTTSSIITSFLLILRRNIVKGGTTGWWNGDSSLTDWQIYNNIFYDARSWTIVIYYDVPTGIFANNTLVDGNRSVDAGDENITFKNNINFSASDVGWYSIGTLVKGYNNATSDDTGEDADFSEGSGNLSNIADPFTDWGADDFTISAEGVVGKAGLDLSEDFTTDFFGVTRVNWTIGAVEYVPKSSMRIKGSTIRIKGAKVKIK